MGTALITGATAGIGNAFARALAARGENLVLVARDAERLERVAAELRGARGGSGTGAETPDRDSVSGSKPGAQTRGDGRERGTPMSGHGREHGVDTGGAGIEVEVLPADLADPEALARVAARLADPDRPVDLLVNNAGFGHDRALADAGLAEETRMLDVLVRAVLVLSHAAVPGMVTRGRGAVVNVSSVAAFVPGGTYNAAKSWVSAFTWGLAIDLAGTGVTATALCPGLVHTEFHQRAQLDMSFTPRWVWLDADRVVADCLADVARGRVVSIPSTRYRLAVAVVRHLPLRVLGRLARRPGGPFGRRR